MLIEKACERPCELSYAINRRQFLALTGALSTLCTGPAHAGADLDAYLDGDEPQLVGFNRLSYCWQQGAAIAVTSNVRLPLYSFVSLILLRSESTTDSHPVAVGELRYITDATHKTTLDVIRNPFNGQRVQVAHEAHRPVRYRLYDNPRSLEIKADSPAVGTSLASPISLGHELVLQFFGNKAIRRVRTGLPDWLKTVTASGYMEMQSQGTIVGNVSLLPTTLLTSARRIHPWIIRDPHGWLDATLRRPNTSVT